MFNRIVAYFGQNKCFAMVLIEAVVANDYIKKRLSPNIYTLICVVLPQFIHLLLYGSLQSSVKVLHGGNLTVREGNLLSGQ